MKKIIIVLVILFSTINSYSQIESEYQESGFQGTEEQYYNPKKEVFLISSCEVSKQYLVIDKLPNKQSYTITIDYEENILTLKMDKVIESYTFKQEDDEYFWGAMPQYNIVKGYLFNEKNEKSFFIVEGGANGSITLSIDKNMKNRPDLYRAGFQKKIK